MMKMLESEPENVHVNENGDMIADVAVTLDGTWQRRGHTSKIGVTFILSVLTGEVLDFSVKSLICHECVAKKHCDKDSDDYKKWLFWVRSCCFGYVKEELAKIYGDDYEIRKEECQGHVQKRMGTGLRELKKKLRGVKLADGKNVGGKNRLTDKMIDKLQNYYRLAIRRNTGDLEGMIDAIWAVYQHTIKETDTSLPEQHNKCSKTSDTWCTYWKSRFDRSLIYDESGRLPPVFREQLNPIFTRLSNRDLLSRCLMGLTQNQNESINGILWKMIPKS